jgi:site-specific DNA-methyltransferase (adenine-specific)
MKSLADNSISSIVTDPPYGLKFMGKKWDYDVPSVEVFAEMLRVCRPGAMLLCFGGTRTYHRLVVNIEDAGWEIRDSIQWIYGSGFPKSLDISKAIDRQAGAEREVVGRSNRHGGGIVGAGSSYELPPEPHMTTAPATDAAKLWNGYGTALKPAHELICVAMKPIDGTFANNAIKWGQAGINIDGCRVGVDPSVDDMMRTVVRKPRESQTWEQGSGFKNETNSRTGVPSQGRFPANLIHDGSPEVLALFPETQSNSGNLTEKSGAYGSVYGKYGACASTGITDSGSAARFFYCAKPSRAERNAGLDGMSEKMLRWSSGDKNPGSFQSANTNRNAQNFHPTVKPLSLMQYLVRLVKPPEGGVILDPYAGSGTTMCACILEGVQGITIERDAEYLPIIKGRIAFFMNGGRPVFDEEEQKQIDAEAAQGKLF